LGCTSSARARRAGCVRVDEAAQPDAHGGQEEDRQLGLDGAGQEPLPGCGPPRRVLGRDPTADHDLEVEDGRDDSGHPEGDAGGQVLVGDVTPQGQRGQGQKEEGRPGPEVQVQCPLIGETGGPGQKVGGQGPQAHQEEQHDRGRDGQPARVHMKAVDGEGLPVGRAAHLEGAGREDGQEDKEGQA